MNKTILVTGGTGYIGSHTVVELINSGYQVIIIDNLSNSSIDVLEGIKNITGIKPKFSNIDISNNDELEELDLLFKNFNIYAVIHFAANKYVNESVIDPLKYYKNNLFSLINLLSIMEKNCCYNLVFSSSCTVYGQPSNNNIPVTENTPLLPAKCPYGNTKQISEEIITDWTKNTSKKTIFLRYFNPIGVHPSLEIGENPACQIPENLLQCINNSIINNIELNVYGGDYNTIDGTCLRDYIDICDLAKAHVKSIEFIEHQKNNVEIFNLGTGKPVSVLQLINNFEYANNIKINYKLSNRRDGDVEKIWADVHKANNILGWYAKTPLINTLQNSYKWIIKKKK